MTRHVDPNETQAQAAVPPAPAPVAAAAPATPARKPWPIAIGVAAAGAAIAGGIAWWWASQAPAVNYVTQPATRGVVARTVTATGTVNPVLTIIVGTYVSGVIKELHCDYNTRVTKGQLCAKIDPRPYQSMVDQARANLSEARAQLEKDRASLAYARLVYERNQRLAQTNAVSRDAVDNAKSLYDQAMAQISLDEANIELRTAQLATAQVNLDYTDIVSPVDGTVVSRNVTMGQTVAASFQTPTLFLIATDLTKMQVDANVSESDIGGIRDGNRASFTVDAFPRRQFSGSVVQVRQSPQTVQNVVTYDVVVGVDNIDLALKPGMTAAVRIVTDRRADVLRVPNPALRYAPAGARTAVTREPGQGRGEGRPGRGAAGQDAERGRVWVLRDDAPVAVEVTVGLSDDNLTEIVSGDLKPGDAVVVSETSGNASGTARTRTPTPQL